MDELISVIIPTYKRAQSLKRALESVLKQDYSNIEIIIVDDNGKSQNQEKNIRDYSDFNYKVRLVTYKDNMGACYARNKGASEARGSVLFFLDDDDYMLPSKISIQLYEIQKTKSDACLCAMVRTDAKGNHLKSVSNQPRGVDFRTFVLDGNGYTSMLAIKKSAFDEVGGFSEIPRFQDRYFLYNFFLAKKKMCHVNIPLYVFVNHIDERISSSGIDKSETALNILHNFEMKESHFFSLDEILFLQKRHLLTCATVRMSGSFSQRIKGIVYLWHSGRFNIVKFIRLLVSDTFILKLLGYRNISRLIN